MLSARLPAAAHARPAECRAWPRFLRPCRACGAPRLLRFSRHGLHARTHFVERGFARAASLRPCRASSAPRLLAFAAAGAQGGDFVVERNAHFVERRLVDFALFT